MSRADDSLVASLRVASIVAVFVALLRAASFPTGEFEIAVDDGIVQVYSRQEWKLYTSPNETVESAVSSHCKSCQWITEQAFLALSAEHPLLCFEQNGGEMLPIETIDGAAVALPYSLVPRSGLAAAQRVFGSIELPERGRRQLEYRIEGEGFAVAAGSVAQTLRAKNGSYVVVLEKQDLELSKQIVKLVEGLGDCIYQLLGSKVSGDLPIIVSSRTRHPALWRLGDASFPITNLILGPYAQDSSVLRAQLAAVLLYGVFDKPAEVEEDYYQAWLLALGDALQQACCGSASIYREPLGTDRALAIVPLLNEQLALPPVNDNALQARMNVIVGVLGYMGSKYLNGALPASERLSKEACVGFQRWLAAGGKDQAMQYLEPRLVEESVVRPSTYRAVAEESGAGVRIEYVQSMRGYLEDCGCKVASAGGLRRLIEEWSRPGRAASVRIAGPGMLTGLDSPLFSVEVNKTIVCSLSEAGVIAYAVGPKELELLAVETLAVDDFEMTAICANVEPKTKTWSFASGVDEEFFGKTVRVIAVVEPLGGVDSERSWEIIREKFVVNDPVSAVQKEIDQLENSLLVVIGHVMPDRMNGIDSRGKSVIYILAERNIPRIGDGGVRQRYQSSGFLGPAPVVFDETSGYGVTVMDWGGGEELLALTSRVLDAPHNVGSAIGETIRGVLESDGNDRVELTYVDPLLADGRGYVGSHACALCHGEQYAQWMGTSHADAMNTLRRAQRQRVRNCTACHVVGFGVRTGYAFGAESTTLENVGCEVCHGPGSIHVDGPEVAGSIRRKPGFDLCGHCHTIEHSLFLLGKQTEYMRAVEH